MGHTFYEVLGPGTAGGYETARGIRVYGVFDGNVQFGCPEWLHCARMKDLGTKVGELSGFIIRKDRNELCLWNKLGISAQIASNILPDLQYISLHGARQNSG